MTNEAASLAALNVSLLEAIKAGGASSPSDLAERAQIGANNVHRKLASLIDAGLIVKIGEAAHETALTEAGDRALEAMAVFHGAGQGGADGVVYIPFDRIHRWADNPRTQFDPADDEDMARSIADKGVLQAITVRARGDDFEVLIGERRRRGAALAVERGLVAPDFRVKCEIKAYSDEEAIEVAGVENLQREDMHWMDEAKWYARLSERLSGSQIERLVGGARKKRSIQDYIKCARELPAEEVARTYLPDGNKDQLTYVRARDLVGEKKERPALDLSPKVAATLLEVIAAGLKQRGIAQWAQGETIVTRFHRAAVGGPLGALQDRKLIAFGFLERQVVARTVLSEDVSRWLKQLAFDDDPEGALWRARTAVQGDLATNAMHRDGLYLTPELNPPPETAATPTTPLPPTEAREPAGEDAEPSADPGGFDFSPDDTFARDGVEREAAEGAEAPSPPTPTAPPAQAAPELPAMLAIVVVEAAHRISTDGIERGGGTWGSPVLVNYYKDGRGAQLVTAWKMLAFLPTQGNDRTLVAVAKAGRDWLWERFGVESPEGRPAVTDEILARAQAELLGAIPVDRYSTPWLNPPAGAAEPTETGEAVNADTGELTAPGAALPPMAAPLALRGDDLTRGVLGLAHERRAKQALAAATRTACTFLASLKARSKPPKADEIDPLVALLENALEAIAPHLELDADAQA